MTKEEEKKSDWYWEIWNKKTNNPNEVIAWLIVEKAKLKEENKKLNEEVRFLEECLDRKEKLNEEYRKEIDELKSDLWECECSFWFENDEVWFWKWEYKRLKKWIKDHCKGYWNLFPEDEMKRQWKKADKKRK
jgi:hypothetical protein